MTIFLIDLTSAVHSFYIHADVGSDVERFGSLLKILTAKLLIAS